jgi:hypothetical protein
MVQQYRAITEFHCMVQRNNTSQQRHTTLVTLLRNDKSFGTGERVTRAILGTLCSRRNSLNCV